MDITVTCSDFQLTADKQHNTFAWGCSSSPAVVDEQRTSGAANGPYRCLFDPGSSGSSLSFGSSPSSQPAPTSTSAYPSACLDVCVSSCVCLGSCACLGSWLDSYPLFI